MPVVFSPGEPETRPLDPTAIVYTSAQKVADKNLFLSLLILLLTASLSLAMITEGAGLK